MSEKLKERAKKLKEKITALYLAGRHKDTPLPAKILTVAVVAYALSPIDLIPDFIPVLGYLDDVILLPLMITFVIKLVPENVMEECIKQAESMENFPKSYVAAIIIVLFWVGGLHIFFSKLFTS